MQRMFKFFIFFIALFVAMPVFAYTALTTNSSANKNSQASGQEVQQLLQLQDKIDAAINTINDSIANIKVGSEIKIDDRVLAMSEQVKKLIEKWDDACSKKAQKPNGALRVESIRPTIGSNSHHQCIIEKCDANKGYERTSNKLECKESKEHADCIKYNLGTWIMGKCNCKYGKDENDNSCMTEEFAKQQKKFDKAKEEEEAEDKYADKIKKEIDKSIANMKIGATMPNPSRLVNNKKFKEAKKAWEEACRKYVRETESVHGQTGYPKSSSNDKMTCLIQECKTNYHLVDSKSCIPQAQYDCEKNELTTWENNKCTCKYGQNENKECKTKQESKQDEKIDDVIKKIQESANTLKVGGSVTIPEKFQYDDKVHPEMLKWEKKCETVVKAANGRGYSLDYDYPLQNMKVTCSLDKCQDKYTKSKDKKSCVKTDLEEGDDCTPDDKNAAKGKYNATKQICEVTECKDKDKYELKDGKCESKKKLDRAQSKADKEYMSDIDKLIAAYNKITQDLIANCKKENKETCE